MREGRLEYGPENQLPSVNCEPLACDSRENGAGCKRTCEILRNQYADLGTLYERGYSRTMIIHLVRSPYSPRPECMHVCRAGRAEELTRCPDS